MFSRSSSKPSELVVRLNRLAEAQRLDYEARIRNVVEESVRLMFKNPGEQRYELKVCRLFPEFSFNSGRMFTFIRDRLTTLLREKGLNVQSNTDADGTIIVTW